MSQQNLEVECETKRVTKTIEVKLQPTEFAQYGKDAADVASELSEINKEFGEVKQSFKGRISEKTARLDHLLGTIKRGTEERLVETEEKHFFLQNVVQTFYNGEMIQERAMTEAERQVNMFAPDAVLPADEEDEPEERSPDGTTFSSDEIAAEIVSETSSRTKSSALDGALEP